MIEFRDARPQDDAQLTRLVASPLPGSLSLAFCREPSYLASCAQCGPPRRVLTAVDGDTVVALCSFYLRTYQWEGQRRPVWLVGDFRALPRYAGRGITGQGWRALRQRLEGHPAMISLLEDNPRALQLFSKSRPHWPRLQPLASLRTNITPLWWWPRERSLFPVRSLQTEQLLEFANSRREPLSPEISREDLGSALPGLERFWGVFSRAGQLLGVAGLSEPRQHRQVRVAGYGGWYARLHRWSRALGRPLLPDPGSQVRLSTACLLSCSQAAPFRALFERLKSEARAAGSSFLVWCQGGSDLSGWFDRLRFRYASRLYQLLWEGEQPLPPLPGQAGYEVAWL
jgi:hypothetical protein